MIIAGLVLAAMAALAHVFIFYLESIAWDSKRARAVFHRTGGPEETEATKLLALNQGFYNLFLAIIAILGIAFTASGCRVVGLTLVFSAVGSMLAAALVLFVASAQHRAAAIRQGVFPLLALVVLAIGLTTR